MALPFAIPLSGGAGGSASSSTDPFFGSLLSNFDTSNWAVNFADFGTATTTAGDKTGPTQTAQPIKNTIPQNTGGLPMSQMVGNGQAIPWNLVYMVGGAALLIMLWKR